MTGRRTGGLWSRLKGSKIVGVDEPCMNCGARQAILLRNAVRPDFDIRRLPADLQKAFIVRDNGVCTNCGLFQSFSRFTDVQLRTINTLGKDVLTTEPAFQSYPPPTDFVEAFNRAHFTLRVQRWNEYFSSIGLRPKRCLFLRYWFGAAPEFVQLAFGAEAAGVEMSEACRRYTSERRSGFLALDGNINGLLEGPFLETGPYDAVFLFHILNHSVDVHRTLSQIKSLLSKDGVVIFTNEVERKPSNPFHMIHPSEYQLHDLLKRHFQQIDRIDACETAFVPHTNPYTLKGDVPDLAALVEVRRPQ